MKNMVVKSLFVAGLGLTVLGGASVSASAHGKHLSISMSKTVMNSHFIKGHATKGATITLSRNKATYGYGKVAQNGTFTIRTRALKGGWKYCVTVSKKGYKSVHQYVTTAKDSQTSSTPVVSSASAASTKSVSSASSSSKSSSKSSASSNQTPSKTTTTSTSTTATSSVTTPAITDTNSAFPSWLAQKDLPAYAELQTEINSYNQDLGDYDKQINVNSQELDSARVQYQKLIANKKITSSDKTTMLNDLLDQINLHKDSITRLVKLSEGCVSKINTLKAAQQKLNPNASAVK